jgi:hypothetical protein
MDACIKNYCWAMSKDITFHTKIIINRIIIIQTMTAKTEPHNMGSVHNDGGIAKGDPMMKGKNEGSEEEEYDDYYGDLEACDDDNRRAHCNAEFRQQLYADMLVEEKNEFDRYNAHVAAGKKAKKKGKWNRDLEIIADEDEERHKSANKMAWFAQLDCLRGMEKKIEDWNVLKRNFKNNGKMYNIVVSLQEKRTLLVEKLRKGVQDMQRIS